MPMFRESGDFELRIEIKLLRDESTNRLVLQFIRLNGAGFEFQNVYETLKGEMEIN